MRRLGCLRGVSTLTAFGLAAEIGDWTRLDRPLYRRLPGTGAHRILLGIDPGAGRSHQNRQRSCPPAVGRSRLASPPPVSARPGSAPTLGRGLSRRHEHAAKPPMRACTPGGSHFDARKKRPVVANAAIARELAGWCWSLAVLDE